MSESMIVMVLSPPRPPTLLKATRVQSIDQATDLLAHTLTFPSASPALDLEAAWTLLTQDKKAAYHFPDEDTATAHHHLQQDTRLSMHERTTLHTALDRMVNRVSTADGALG